MAGFERSDFSVLSTIHRDIFEKFQYVTDEQKWGMIERWEDSSTLKNVRRAGVAKFTGDCEEFALASMEILRSKGYNTRIVVCRTETGEGHAICEAASADYEEAYYFDNRQLTIRTLKELSKYKFLAVSPWNPEPSDTRPWMRVEQPVKS